MPLPGARVIPARWSERHRLTAVRAMTATCVISRNVSQGSTGPDGKFIPPSRTTIYSGPCRVVPRATDEGRHRLFGERTVTPRRYEIGIRHDETDIHLGDLVTFTEAADPGLVGLTVRVIDVAYSSEQWQRQLFAQELQEGVS